MEKIQTQSKKIRQGDRVIAISGNSKGQTGVVRSRRGDKVIVEGLNMRKKHIKKSQDIPKGRIIDIEAPIHVSNLKVCVEDGLAARLKIRSDEQGDRHFVYTKGDEEIVYRSVKKPK